MEYITRNEVSVLQMWLVYVDDFLNNHLEGERTFNLKDEEDTIGYWK